MSDCVFDLGPLQQLARTALGDGPLQLEEMPGGMSPRRFVRVRGNDQSAVGMFFPDGRGSDEVSTGSTGDWPFIEVQKLLFAAGVRVPRLIATAKSDGWLLVEDFGDMTLAQQLLAHPEQRDTLYKTAVSDLVAATRRLGTLTTDSIVKSRSFDTRLLRWEVAHFREWALEARGIHLSPSQAARYERVTDQLVQRIEASKYGFTHRDYQSRNLMVLTGEQQLGWIDFQDALMGPRVYDLVALLGDSYQTFAPEFVRARIAQFCHLQDFAEPEILTEFHLVSIQRKLKDAGRFVFADKVRHEPQYLQFVSPTIGKIRRAVAALGPQDPTADLAVLLDELSL